jgi:hypothetical protein
MTKLQLFIFGAVISVLAGCASKPQLPIALPQAALSTSTGRIGVVMTAIPKVDTDFPGAHCLLCYGVAMGMHSALTAHVRTLPLEDLPELADKAGALIKSKGAVAVLLKEPLKLSDLPDFSDAPVNHAKKDFRSFREKHKVDSLFVIQVDSLGVWRNYSGYVPVAEPKAVFNGVVYMVNTTTNALTLYEPIALAKAGAKWDQAPKFPDLTNAYFQVLEVGKEAILRPLK